MKLWKEEWTWSFTENPLNTWKEEWINYQPIHLHLLSIITHHLWVNNIMPYTNILKLSSFYGWIIKLFKIYFLKV
jgi:hypothetical protein